MFESVLQQYGLDSAQCVIEPFGSGLINHTWTVTNGAEKFILQRINDNIFKQPALIEANIRQVVDYLKINHPAYLFAAPLQTPGGRQMVQTPEGYFRLFPFIKASHTIDVVANTQQAYEAAKQFGAFTKKLSGFNVSELQVTLPQFHDLSLRYRQYEHALANGDIARIETSSAMINAIESHKNIVDQFEKIRQDAAFKLRVTHHDTKISNVLFDEHNKGLCVIDLDTIMPGYFISDVGDMLRTYLSPASEEEKDIAKISIRKDIFKAIQEGYLSQMENELTEKEKQYFVYAGQFMTYMQALRFFTDYLNDDVYYGSKYSGHNYVRAQNQLALLEQLMLLQ
ncbi:phosphotransferase enzyme family protein [Ferruginibacter sp.]